MDVSRKVNSDFLLRILTFALIAFGIVMVSSASTLFSTYYYENPWHFTTRQIFWIILGGFAMIIISKLKPAFIEKCTPIYYWGVIALLIGVLFFGVERNGAKSWFGIGFLGIQPTEFAKLAVIMGLAKLISRRKELYENPKKGLIPSLLVIGLIIFLVMCQPDFGSTLIICGASFFMLFIGGVRMKHLLMLLGAAVLLLSVYVIYLISEDSYKIDRYSAFIDPFADMEGTGFQLVQSLFAFGNGGMFGVGYGESIQKLPMYLPMAYNDFIFPIIGEELGFLGILLFFTLFFLFLGRSLFLSLKSKNMYFMLTGVGIVMMLALQAFINIGGVTGSIPMTGVTLPFISYGGSSFLATMLSVGILLSISKQIKLEQPSEEQS